MAYNPFDDVINNDPAYMADGGGLQVTMGGSEDAKRGLDYLRKSGQNIEGYTIPQLEALGRINNLKFPSSAYQKAAETLAPLEGEELDEYNNQFFTRKRFPGVSVAEVGKSVYDFLGKGTGPQVQEQMDRNKEILKRNTYRLPPDVKPGSREEGLLIKKYEKEIAKSLKEQGYDDISVGRFLQNMFFGEGKEAYDVMDEGMAYSDLPDPLKSGANPFWLLLDSVDALTLGSSGLLLAGGRKLTPKFINFLKNAKNKKMPDADIVTQAKQQFPDEFATIVTSNNTALEQAGIPVSQTLQRQADTPGGSQIIKFPKNKKVSKKDLKQEIGQVVDLPKKSTKTTISIFEDNYEGQLRKNLMSGLNKLGEDSRNIWFKSTQSPLYELEKMVNELPTYAKDKNEMEKLKVLKEKFVKEVGEIQEPIIKKRKRNFDNDPIGLLVSDGSIDDAVDLIANDDDMLTMYKEWHQDKLLEKKEILEDREGFDLYEDTLLKQQIKKLEDTYSTDEGVKNYILERDAEMAKQYEDEIIYPDPKKPKGFALGGTAEDYTQNVDLMSDRFMKDPAFEQEDAFAKSLEGATAFNPFKLHKLFKKSPGVATPKNLREVGLYNQLVDTQNMGGADVGIETLLPTVKPISDNDFAFKSFTVDKLNSTDAPKNATPESWRQFLKGGELQAPESELLDSGMEDFFIDSDKMYPGRKISREQLIDIYNESPVGNIEIKVKDKPKHGEQMALRYEEDLATLQDSREYTNYVGRPRHENFGSAPMDSFGKNYREIVIQSGPIPNDKSPYVQSSHFEEPNVIGFTRVADYKNSDGQAVAVIQELQTDLLTTVNNEQQRLNAMVKRAKKQSEELNEIYNNPLSDANDRDISQRKLQEIKKNMGGRTIEELENMSVTKPFPTNVGREKISSLQTDLISLQDEINELVFRQNQSPLQSAGLEDSIFGIQNKQIKIFDDLASMNREHTYEQKLQGVRVPNVSDTDITKELADYVESDGGRAFSIGTKELRTFPPVPFSRPGDYIDLLLKATIKDAQNKGIKKIAIMPADVGANKRWGKTGDAAKRFRDLYDKKMIQELKNIKKKYPGSELRLENIQDPSKPEASFFGKRLQADGTFEELSGEIIEEVPQINFKKSMDDEDVLRQIRAFDDSYGLENTKAFVSFKQEDGSEIIQRIVKSRVPEGRVMQDSSFKLSDDYTTQDLKEAQFMFDEFNPQSVPMYVLDISTSSAQTGPMYLYRKKEGGTIDKDRLVSITDIYGSYGR
jgi:hypothetical protein